MRSEDFWIDDLFSCTCDCISESGDWYVYKPSSPNRVISFKVPGKDILTEEQRKELYFEIYRCDKCRKRVEKSSIVENAKKNQRLDTYISDCFVNSRDNWDKFNKEDKLNFIRKIKEYLIDALEIGKDEDIFYLQQPEVFLEGNMGNNLGYTDGINKIFLNSDLGIYKMVETLAHEVFHIKQHEEVKLCEFALEINMSKIGPSPMKCKKVRGKMMDPMVHFWKNEILAYEKGTDKPRSTWTIEDHIAFHKYEDQYIERNAREYAQVIIGLFQSLKD